MSDFWNEDLWNRTYNSALNYVNNDYKEQTPIAPQIAQQWQIIDWSKEKPSFWNEHDKLIDSINTNTPNKSKTTTVSGSKIGNQAIPLLTNQAIDQLFQKTDFGGPLGSLFSTGLSSVANTGINNLIKGEAFTKGMAQNASSAVSGTVAGLTGNLIGKGITSAGGNSMLSRGLGQAVATGIGGFGGTVLSNLVKGESLLTGFSGMSKATKAAHTAALAARNTAKATELASAAKFANIANIAGLAGQAVGTGLQAAFGPSKEYAGKYGNITRTMDTIYDLGQTAASFMGPYGAIVAGGMALNKGLSNVFGSTDGMTVQDAILGSAFMPAPIKWVNMWGSSKTGDFYGQSRQNIGKVNNFMGNAFGDLGDRFSKAREEANKTYGTFSHGAKKEAQDNIDFANSAWSKVLDMAYQNEYQNIRAQDMTSINNQRYAQAIQGGWTPLYRGKQGMKIFNNATNHNIGMRLLSAAALIDNKAMILCAAHD